MRTNLTVFHSRRCFTSLVKQNGREVADSCLKAPDLISGSLAASCRMARSFESHLLHHHRKIQRWPRWPEHPLRRHQRGEGRHRGFLGALPDSDRLPRPHPSGPRAWPTPSWASKRQPLRRHSSPDFRASDARCKWELPFQKFVSADQDIRVLMRYSLRRLFQIVKNEDAILQDRLS